MTQITGHLLHLLILESVKLTCEYSALKWSMACFLSSPCIEPSSR